MRACIDQEAQAEQATSGSESQAVDYLKQSRRAMQKLIAQLENETQFAIDGFDVVQIIDKLKFIQKLIQPHEANPIFNLEKMYHHNM